MRVRAPAKTGFSLRSLGSVPRMATPQQSLVDGLLESSAGAVLLAAVEGGALEAEALDDVRDFDLGATSSATIGQAVALVHSAAFYDLMAIAVHAAHELAGPHSLESPWRVARALRQAPGRRPIAEAVLRRFRNQLEAPLHRPDQQWWCLFDLPEPDATHPLGTHPHAGRHWAWFTAPADGFFTVNPAPTSMREAVGPAWDADSYDFTRWALTVAPSARVLEIHRPDDWAALVRAHPCDTRTGNYQGWEIAGEDRHLRHDVDEFDGLPDQRSARWGVQRFLEPDWASVADEWDAVHLSWSGLLTTEGTTIDLAPGEVAMLRGWASERTVWLNPVLTHPRPIHPSASDRPGPIPPDPEDRSPDLRINTDLAARQNNFLDRKLNLGTQT